MAVRTLRFEVYRDRYGDWRWRLKAANGRIVMESGEGYSAKRKVLDALYRFMEWAASEELEDALARTIVEHRGMPE